MSTDKKIPASEQELITLFKRMFEPEVPPSDLIIGIGDDAAAIEPGADPESKFVITADMLVEDVHFTRKHHSFYDIGWRTAVASISDIAAMGALPRWGVVTLAAPQSDSPLTTDEIMELCRGLKEAMGEFDAYVIGGDLTRTHDKIVISMTLIGETTGRLLTRVGAQLGDVVAVTGNLGSSAAGLALLQNQDVDFADDLREKIIQKHLKPEPRVVAGQVLSNIDGIRAVMDISDGLGMDIGRICTASKVGVRIFEERIPISDEVLRVALALDRDHLEFATAGEDFELLIVGDNDSVERAGNILAEESEKLPLTMIGEIIDHPFGMHLARVDGAVVNPAELGWDHFRGRDRSDA